MDGLAAGVVGIIAVAYLALPGILGNSFALAVAWSVAGTCVAYLFYNFPPAEIHMGDAGSTALGFSVAFVGLDFYRSHLPTRSALLFPLLTAALPLLDAICAVVRRLRNRAPPLQGDRAHLYDRTFARGSTPRQIALASYAITAALAGIALLGVHRESLRFWILSALSVVTLLYAAVQLGSLQGDDRSLPTHNATAPQIHKKCAESSSTS